MGFVRLLFGDFEKNKKIVLLVDFGSIHLEYQQKLMSSYNSEFKINKTMVNPWMIQRQNEEFLNLIYLLFVTSLPKKVLNQWDTILKIYVKHPNLDLSMFKINKILIN